MGKNYTKKQVEKAVIGSGGIILNVAKKLKCNWLTAKRYIDKNNFHELMEAENEANLDKSESGLFQHIEEGSLRAIEFHLRTKGRNRGYSDSHKVEHSGQINQTHSLDYEECMKMVKKIKNGKK